MRFIPLIILGIGALAFFVFDLGQYFSLETLREQKDTLIQFVEQNPFLAVGGLSLIYIVSVALSAPIGLYLTLLCGFLLGPWLGVPVVVISATIGACIIFLAARGALADFFRERTGSWFQKLASGFEKNAFSYLLFLRLIPVFPFFVVNVVPAFLGMRFIPYAIATMIGILPGTTVYILLGRGLGIIIDKGGTLRSLVSGHPEIQFGLGGLAILALLPVIYKRLKRTS